MVPIALSLLLVSSCTPKIGNQEKSAGGETEKTESAKPNNQAKLAENTQPESDNSDGTASLPKTIYRSDQFSPGLMGEWIEVTFSSDRASIQEIRYWYVDNQSRNASEKEVATIQKDERYEGEEVGIKGEIQLPGSDEFLKFRIVEGVFEIVRPDGTTQTFAPES